MKKRKGTVVDILSTLIAVIASAIIMVAFLDILKVVSYKEDIRQIARGYILKMEATGYLIPEDKSALIQKLTDMQLENISLNGTTDSAVGYGAEVVLNIKGSLPAEVLNVTTGNMFTFFFSEQAWNIEIKLASSAKY